MRRFGIVAAVALLLSFAAPAAAVAPPAPIDASVAGPLCAAYFGVQPGPEPLSACQWGLRYVHAQQAWSRATGRGVKVGVIDTGVDMTHPDLRPNLDVALSCSFIFSDTPTANPAEVGNGDCSNKAAVQDLEGHGTHVATTIAAPLNGLGIAGVAPNATIVALKACTYQGFCFVDSVVAALLYAGTHHLDAVNMSFYADPYLFYCHSAADQRAMLQELQDAARFAEQQGVVLVAAAGNNSLDLGHPTMDDTSPDWPPDTAVTRTITNECRMAPAELPGVITVSASGVTTLAEYSDVGTPVDVTAPGGDVTQTPGVAFGRILAGWSSTDETGEWEDFVAAGRGVVDHGARYVWLAGTSMATPHVTGIVALIRQLHPGWSPGAIAAAVRRTATPLDCPSIPNPNLPACYGGPGHTTYFGAGMVNAFGAVSH